MPLIQRVATIVLTLGLSASLVGCGFYLKGTNPSVAPIQYSNLQITVPKNSGDLDEKLSLYLASSGVQLSSKDDSYRLNVLSYSSNLLELQGILRENILRLTVTFRIEDAAGNALTENRTVSAIRNYQYNAATVNTDNQEEKYLREMLIDDVAQQIARQISSNRLDKLTNQ